MTVDLKHIRERAMLLIDAIDREESSVIGGCVAAMRSALGPTRDECDPFAAEARANASSPQEASDG